MALLWSSRRVSSLLAPWNERSVLSSTDHSGAQSRNSVSVSYRRSDLEHHRKVTAVLDGAKGTNNTALVRQADAGGGAEQPELRARLNQRVRHVCRCERTEKDTDDEGEVATDAVQNETLGVRMAIAALNLYKREISPFLPGSCRYVPTCSEYSMQAYRAYGVFKGTILTAWRLARCNPLGGNGFDPPRWFGESKPPSL